MKKSVREFLRFSYFPTRLSFPGIFEENRIPKVADTGYSLYYIAFVEENINLNEAGLSVMAIREYLHSN